MVILSRSALGGRGFPPSRGGEGRREIVSVGSGIWCQKAIGVAEFANMNIAMQYICGRKE